MPDSRGFALPGNTVIKKGGTGCRKTARLFFETEDNQVKIPVTLEGEMVWLNREQISELFDRDVKTIGKHIDNAHREELPVDNSTVAKFATVQIEGGRVAERKIEYYS